MLFYRSIVALALATITVSQSVPSCFQPCFNTATMTTPGCSASDLACLCVSADFYQIVATCFSKMCATHNDLIGASGAVTQACLGKTGGATATTADAGGSTSTTGTSENGDSTTPGATPTAPGSSTSNTTPTSVGTPSATPSTGTGGAAQLSLSHAGVAFSVLLALAGFSL